MKKALLIALALIGMIGCNKMEEPQQEQEAQQEEIVIPDNFEGNTWGARVEWFTFSKGKKVTRFSSYSINDTHTGDYSIEADTAKISNLRYTEAYVLNGDKSYVYHDTIDVVGARISENILKVTFKRKYDIAYKIYVWIHEIPKDVNKDYWYYQKEYLKIDTP